MKSIGNLKSINQDNAKELMSMALVKSTTFPRMPLLPEMRVQDAEVARELIARTRVVADQDSNRVNRLKKDMSIFLKLISLVNSRSQVKNLMKNPIIQQLKVEFNQEIHLLPL